MNAATRDYLLAHRDQSAADVAAALAADYLTALNLNRKTLAAHLLTTGLYDRLEAARQDPAVPEELRAGLNKLWFTLQSGIDYLGTAESATVAEEAKSLLDGLEATGHLSADERAALLQLSGGYRYDRLSAEEITAHWAELDAATAFDALTARAAAGWNGVARWLAELRASGEPLPTDAEVVARYAVGLG